MFIEISWKNKKGDTLRSFIESTKVQGFINSFVERDVEPVLTMPDEVTIETPAVLQA
tara:strand:+ start:3044 stop:3214 length:171 start_codon:yes stop_codon:yes gene_type:complete